MKSVPLKPHQPIIQFIRPVQITHFGAVSRHNLYEVTHDIREEGHTAQLNETRREHYHLANGVVVSVPHRA